MLYICDTRYQMCMKTVSQSTDHDREISKADGASVIKSDPSTAQQLPFNTVSIPEQPHQNANIQQGSSIKQIFSSLRNTFDVHFNPNIFCPGVLLREFLILIINMYMAKCDHGPQNQYYVAHVYFCQ